MAILLADVGGTNIRTAWTEDGNDVRDISLSSADQYESLLDALNAKCGADGINPDSAIIAVAGPVLGDTINFTNRGWEFSQTTLKSEMGLQELLVINDFAAVALSLPSWKPGDIDYIKPGAGMANSPMLAIGPGTGLGVSAAIPSGENWIAVAGEGGHCPAVLDGLVPDIARQRLGEQGSVTWETIISGPGLSRLHAALHNHTDRISPDEIQRDAAMGDDQSTSTVNVFSALLGRRAADAALLFGAWGGVFLAGGVVKALANCFDRDAFHEEFSKHEKEFLKDVPVGILTAEYPAFSGLAYLAKVRRSLDSG